MPFVYFIVMVGVLVFVHELGHFVFAKYFGVRVLRFSLGFGPRIAGFHRGGTEYVLSALPLGGYVRMLGENPRDEVNQPYEGSFAGQAIWRRLVIVVGGPMMSLLFPILLYFVVFLGDTQLTPATVGSVFPGLPAYGKLLPGDRIVAVDGDEITTFYELNRAVEGSAGRRLQLTVEREDEVLQIEIVPQKYVERVRVLDIEKPVGRIGVTPHFATSVVGVASAESAAAAARMRTFDRVVAAGGHHVDRWIDLERQLQHNRGGLVPLTYFRPVPVRNALGGFAQLSVYEPRIAALTANVSEGTVQERFGLELADLYISHVISGSPEHRAGLLPGDKLLALDGEPIELWAAFRLALEHEEGRRHEVTFLRNGEVRTAGFWVEGNRGKGEPGQPWGGLRHWVPTVTAEALPNPAPLRYAFSQALRETATVVELTVYSVVRLLQGRLSSKSIGGPLTIFEVAGTAAEEGPLNYLTLMAFISINLGLINLLPIPLLDGGHLPFLLFEAVARRPLGVKVREYAHIAGLAVLLSLMVLAFKNDIERQWPRIVDHMTDR